jgi:hypothetical protein
MDFGLLLNRTYLIARSAEWQNRFFKSQQQANKPALPTPKTIEKSKCNMSKSKP